MSLPMVTVVKGSQCEGPSRQAGPRLHRSAIGLVRLGAQMRYHLDIIFLERSARYEYRVID